MNVSTLNGNATPVRSQVDAKVKSYAMRSSGIPTLDDAVFPGIYPVATMTGYLSSFSSFIFFLSVQSL